MIRVGIVAVIALLLAVFVSVAVGDEGDDGLQVQIDADLDSMQVGEAVSVQAVVSNAPEGETAEYQWGVAFNGISFHRPRGASTTIACFAEGEYLFTLEVTYKPSEESASASLTVACTNERAIPTPTSVPSSPPTATPVSPMATPTPPPPLHRRQRPRLFLQRRLLRPLHQQQ